MDEQSIKEICEVCEKAEEIVEPSNKSICATREMIAKLAKIQLGITNQNAYLYLERILYPLKAKLQGSIS